MDCTGIVLLGVAVAQALAAVSAAGWALVVEKRGRWPHALRLVAYVQAQAACRRRDRAPLGAPDLCHLPRRNPHGRRQTRSNTRNLPRRAFAVQLQVKCNLK